MVLTSVAMVKTMGGCHGTAQRISLEGNVY
jgi:hypothetical protein